MILQIAYPKSPLSHLPSRRAFSLVEVLLAIFILGIGMIMVASVFPVGANWTRQTAEESVGQTVAQNALAVIQSHYGPGGDLRGFVTPDATVNTILSQNATSPFNMTPFTVQALPGFLPNYPPNNSGIPLSERAYQFGSSNPFPASNVASCTYFWTALARLNPVYYDAAGVAAGTNHSNGILLSSSYTYDVYIMVFRKGAVEHSFAFSSPPEVPFTRDPTWLGMPSTLYAIWNGGQFNGTTWVSPALPSIGQYGIGALSGTVFHQVLNSNYNGAMPSPMIITTPEPVIYAPAAIGTANSASPLIYVYQTTMSF